MSGLYRIVVIVVIIVLVLGLLQSGTLDVTVGNLSTVLTRLTTPLRTLLLAVSIPALLIGGLVAISPGHRKLGGDLALGGLIALVLATAGPVFMHWLTGAMTTYSNTILGGGTTP